MKYHNGFAKTGYAGLYFIMLTLAGSGVCFSQVNRGRQLNRSQQFRLGSRIIRVAEPGQLADTVNVWGDINSPGRYLIPTNTTLPELISYALGPNTIRNGQTQLNWSKRRVEVSVSQKSPTKGKDVVKTFTYKFDQPLPDGMRTFKLKNNQVVAVQVKRRPSFKDYLGIIAPIISAVATGVLLVLRLGKIGE
jgi:hypothetical protein